MMRILLIIFLLVASFSFPTPVSADQSIQINEVMIHPLSTDGEWVEFYVPDGKDITGYWIDDDTDFQADTSNSKKIQLNTFVAGTDRNHLIYELSPSAAMFNNSGDLVVLFDQQGNIVDQYTYTKDPGVNISVGRSPDSTGEIMPLSNITKGSANSGPRPTITPTPQPTTKPTKQPTSTPSPTPIKVKNTSTPVPTVTIRVSPSPTKILNTLTPQPSIASNGAYPTAVLGAKTEMKPSRAVVRPTSITMVKGASTNWSSLFFVGGFGLVSCAILVYFRKEIMEIIKREK